MPGSRFCFAAARWGKSVRRSRRAHGSQPSSVACNADETSGSSASGTASGARQSRFGRSSLTSRSRRDGLRVLFLEGGPMRITYDREVDALYFRFRETTVTTKHLGEGIAADYDAEGRLAGIEILDAAKRLGDPGVLRQVIVEGIGSECD